MRKLNKREKFLLILAIVIIIGVSTTKLVIIPLWTGYQGLNSKLSTREHQWKKSKLTLKSGKRLKGNLEEIKGELIAINSLFFNKELDKVKLEVLNTLDSYIKSSNLELKNKDLELDHDSETNLSKVVCRLALKGELTELIKFLERLNQTKRLYMVENLDLSGGENTTQLSISMIVKVINRKGDINEINE